MSSVSTIMVHSSDGRVMAPLNKPGEYFKGKWVTIRITNVGPDEETPLPIRQALVGLEIETIFLIDELAPQIGTNLGLESGSRLAYAQDVINSLIAADRKEAAEQLRKIAGNELDFYVFEPGIFEEI